MLALDLEPEIDFGTMGFEAPSLPNPIHVVHNGQKFFARSPEKNPASR